MISYKEYEPVGFSRRFVDRYWEMYPDKETRVSGVSTETSFRFTSETKSHVVFENPDHDFPKRISYKREGDIMTANVSAGKKGLLLNTRKSFAMNKL